MNNEKLWEEIENCLKYDDVCCYDKVFLHTTSIENLIDLFENKETDLLKEFVEWLKGKHIIFCGFEDGSIYNRDEMLEKFL